MRRADLRRLFVSKLLLIAAAWSISSPAAGARLPVTFYTTVDGLPSAHVDRVLQDSHGMLWFATEQGLSRFDGYRFVTYGMKDGLPGRAVTDLLEISPGIYWVASGTTLCRFDLSAAAPAASHCTWTVRIDSPRSGKIRALHKDRAARLWIGTEDGLFTLDANARLRRVELGFVGSSEHPPEVLAFAEDGEGNLWIGTRLGLARRSPDGTMRRLAISPSRGDDPVRALLCDRHNRLWIGHDVGLALMRSDEGLEWAFGNARTRLHAPVLALAETYDGRVWIGTDGGLTSFDGTTFRTFTTVDGLGDGAVMALTEDRQHNLWIGTDAGGAGRLSPSGLVLFGEKEGLRSVRIASIFENAEGRLFVTGGPFIHRFDGDRFDAVRPALPRGIRHYGWGWHQVTFQDRTGGWWLPTEEGLVRFRSGTPFGSLAHARASAVYSTRSGLPSDDVFRLYEDSRGDVWIGTITADHDVLTRWEHRTGTMHRYGQADGIPRIAPTAFAEDRAGNLWIGFYSGLLARYRDGRFDMAPLADAPLPGVIRDLYVDGAGRLWVATNRGGVGRIDRPGSPRPAVIAYTTEQGLASNDIRCITEDRAGRIYIGSALHIDRLDPATGRIRRLSGGRDLPNGELNVAFRDRQGALWFGTLQGLARLIPGDDVPLQPPSTLITAITAGDTAIPLSAAGEIDVAGVKAPAADRRLQIEFVGMGSGADGPLRYQYRLDSLDPDWSRPAEDRLVNYASLRPGEYTFRVRAVTAGGVLSPRPATVVFAIEPPLWQRAWVIGLVATALLLLLIQVHRIRVARLVEIERIRTQIAADLHDDVGASLSRMAVLAEVVRRDLGITHAESSRRLGDVAESARRLVDAMGDIVWSVDPRRDDLMSVMIRLRQFASGVLEARGIAYEFRLAPDLDRCRLRPEQRRQLFLILKEAITNAVRHADCDSVSFELALAGHWLMAVVRDNGKGLHAADTNGNGLESMRARSRRAGGSLEISSSPGMGTRLVVRMPAG